MLNIRWAPPFHGAVLKNGDDDDDEIVYVLFCIPDNVYEEFHDNRLSS